MKEAKSRNFFLPLDLILVIVSYFFSYQLRFEWTISNSEYLIFLRSLPVIIILRIATFYYCGLYKNLWKYVGVRDLVSIISACTVSSVLIITIIFLSGISGHSRTIFLIDWILCISLIGGSRLLLRLFNENMNFDNKIRKNVLIIGAGDVGESLLRLLDRNKYNVLGFIDDDDNKHGRTIHGVKVLGNCQDILDLAPIFRIEEVLITVADLSSDEMKLILRYCKQSEVRYKIVPAVSDLLSGSVHLSKLREVEISDLFGRQPIELDLSAIHGFLKGKRILVTGGGGSIGSELCRQIADYEPECIILVDKNENYLHEIRCELNSDFPSVHVACSLGDITDKRKQSQLFGSYRPEIVFHTAAQKHVPLSEENPDEAIRSNVLGTQVIADLANDFGVQEFVMVSTDKAVNPTSIMGVTKRIAELYIQKLSRKSATKFVTVRFGNVLNSNGSVIPIFLKQIEKGGPVTVTHQDVERYFMSISEAVQLILQAVTMGRNGEIFILDMGKSIRIVDLAIELIKQSGLKPYEDIPIIFTGLRLGEKLFEELVGGYEKCIPTSHSSIKTLKSNRLTRLSGIEEKIKSLTKISYRLPRKALISKFRELVPEYTPFLIPQTAMKGISVAENESETSAIDIKENLTSAY